MEIPQIKNTAANNNVAADNDSGSPSKPAKDAGNNPTFITIDVFVAHGRQQEEQLIQNVRQKSREITRGLADNPIMADIEKYRNNPRMLAHILSRLVQMVESQIPELKHDKPGWDGNNLRFSVDINKVPQFYCTDQACVVVEILDELTKMGTLPNHKAKAIDSSAHGTHTAAALYGKDNDTNPVIILDPWMSEPSDAPKTFFNIENEDGKTTKQNWEKAFKKYVQTEEQNKKTFQTSFKYKDHKLEKPSEDYTVLKFFTNDEIRFAITPQAFSSFRDRLIFFLDKEGYWDNLENGKDIKQKIASLNIKDKSKEEVEETWKTLEPFLKVYFNIMYPGNELVAQRFPN